MSYPTSFNAFHERVIEVLTEGEGTGGNIIPAGTFRYGVLHQGTSDVQAARMVLEKPHVSIEDLGIEDTGALPNTLSFAQYEITATILAAYDLPHELWTEKRDEVVRVMLNNAHTIRKALTNPGNLSQTAGGNDTGLVSGMLKFEGGPPIQLNFRNSLAKQRLQFSGIIHVSF